ncbi:MAG: MarR family transcriptional regulator [Ardenticatenaceae bacterium]|nr:MarR family transcriptional regulator [Anaerolineales bacterium]MCB8923153.1 MarR family transcriptional regulator [Ardenticatenaceae bacterium]MCB9005198.1 MarR family transcriptional regulator [Ardenticatenaceae bacterium]
MCDKELLYNLIKETFLLIDDGDRRFFYQFDLTVSRYYALYHIAENPGISFSQLSDRMVCDKSNVTRIIKGLEASGYVTRQPHETDGRTLRLYLTEEGTAVQQQAALAHKIYNDARLRCITDLQHDNLVEGLTRLNEHIRTELSTVLA